MTHEERQLVIVFFRQLINDLFNKCQIFLGIPGVPIRSSSSRLMKATLHAMPASLVDNTGDKHSDMDGRPLFYYKATGKSNNRSIKEEAKGKKTSVVPMAVMLQSPIVVKDEKKDQSVGYERSGEMGSLEVESLICIEDSSRPTSPNHNASSEKQVKHDSARVEMVKAKEENERLKLTLAGTVKDHQSLQMHFFEIVQPEQSKKPIEAPSIHHDVEESALVSLRLGTSSTKHKKEDKASTCDKRQEDEQIKEGLTLALDREFGGSGNSPSGAPITLSREDSCSELKENETTGPWPPCKIRKNLRSGEDEMLQQIGVKRARISVRTRCTDRTLYDGCQWRKYGEKIAKGNPCPRAYYRCTVAQRCPVKKQVQRCAEDTSILITTYEGIHNHPLPVSAATIASTTSAAACLLMSGSSTSRPLIRSSASFPATTSMTTSANLHGLNFTPSENCRPGQFYLANSSVSPSHPTITLDLIAPSPSNSTITPSSRYSTSLNLSSSQHNAMQSSCSSGYLSYGAQHYNISQTGSLSFVRQYQDSFYQSGMATNTSLPLADTSFINTVAEAITSDPSFQSALAAAITTYVGVRGAE